jgi:hypothetical protein
MMDDDECGAVGGIIISTGIRGTHKNLPQNHLANHKSQLTSPGIEPGRPQWEA